jgi:hypothetical protein
MLGLRDAALALLAQNEDTANALKAAKVNYPGMAVAAVVIPDTTLTLNTPLGMPSSTYHAPLTVQEVAKRGEVAAAPACGDGKPAKLRPSGFYSCYGWDR